MEKYIKQMKNILFLMNPYWKYGKLYVILSLIVSVIFAPINTLAGVLFIQSVVDAIVDGKTFDYVLLIIIIYLSIQIGVGFIQIAFNNLYKEAAGTRITQKINLDLYNNALKTDYKYFDDPEFYNNYTWAIREYASNANEAIGIIDNIFRSLTIITTMLSMIIILGPWIVIFSLVEMVLTIYYENKRNKINIEKKNAIIPLDRKLDYVHRIFYQREYAADLKIMDIKRYFFDIYKENGNGKIKLIKKSAKSIVLWLFAQNFTALLYNTLILAYISYSIIVTKRIDGVGKFTGLMAANSQLMSSLYGFFGIFSQINRLSLYADKIKTFFDSQSTIEMNMNSKQQILASGPIEVCFNNVTFSYSNSNFAIKNLNLKIAKGERIAIVGENGVGKSTLVKLLLRLYDVTEGEILFNGLPISNYNIESFRSGIGVALQSTNIYALSFADNLQVYKPVDDFKLTEVIDKMSLNKVLVKSNADISSEVTKEFSKDGIMLSGGEKQKIAIARLFTNDFGLLILDEPSSALDPIAEDELVELMYDRSKSITSIIIAHRLSTIRDADRIYVMSNGMIIEFGDHDELMRSHGKYHEMFTKQSKNYTI